MLGPLSPYSPKPPCWWVCWKRLRMGQDWWFGVVTATLSPHFALIDLNWEKFKSSTHWILASPLLPFLFFFFIKGRVMYMFTIWLWQWFHGCIDMLKLIHQIVHLNLCSIFLFFFFNFCFIYLFMAVLCFRFCARAFSSWGKWGPLFIAVHGSPIIAASLVAEHRLQTRRLSSCGSRA